MSYISKRLLYINRINDISSDRNEYIRLDRNEDPDGWPRNHFKNVINKITPSDFSCYTESETLKKKIADLVTCKEENIFITSGADGAIKTICEIYLDNNDKVLIEDPSWPMYEVYSNAYTKKIEKIAYSNNLTLNPKIFCELIQKEKIKLVIIANPNMPTGTIKSLKSLEEILKIAYRRKTIVVIDEAYYWFSNITLSPLIKKYSNLIIVRTFSKAFGLAGLRVGYCISSKKRINELFLLKPIVEANSLGIKISEYALDNFGWLRKKIDDIIGAREYIHSKLTEKNLHS